MSQQKIVNLPAMSSGKGSSSTPGKGNKATPQGMITVGGWLDRPTLESNVRAAASRKTLYPKAIGTEDLDVHAGEFAFSFNVPRSRDIEDADKIHFATSLTSYGSDAVENFPFDEEFQREAVMNKIKYQGVTRDMLKFSDGNKRQGVALQTGGISSHFAPCDCPPGCLAELIPPLPSEIGYSDRPKRPGVNDTKIVLEVRPKNPRTIESKISAHLRSYAENAAKYKGAMGAKYRTTDSWVNFCETTYLNHWMSFVLILNRLVDAKILAPTTFADATTFNVAADDKELNTHDTLIAMTAALGHLDGVNDLPQKGISIKKEHRERYELLKRDLAKTVDYDGKCMNLAFSYRRDETGNARDEGKDRKTGRPLMSTSEGRMLYLQYNHTKMMIGAISDAIRRDQEWIIGKIVKGASSGGKIDILQ